MTMSASFQTRLMRRKQFVGTDISQSNLKRCLTLVDLVALGIGTTLGAGAYVLSGQVAKRDAGPAVVVSFLIAAATSMLAGLCYAEFGARIPKAGSAYVYTYVTVGEVVAFVIGWDLILEYIIGTACVSRTASGYVDDLVGESLVDWFSANLAIHTFVLAPYADLLALGIVLFLTTIVAAGVKESAVVTKLLTGLNLAILGYAIVAGFFKDDPRNWTIPVSEVPKNLTCGRRTDNSTGCGDGGFAPYGFSGIVKGAATCFFAFIGFDSIATTGEEAKNPQRNIPLATVISLFIVFCVYVGVSVTLTMMTPYFELDTKAPFATMFRNAGWTISRYIVSVGAVIALTASLLGGMFPMPRVIMAMARDGLLFRFLGRVEKRVKTPVIATLIAGTLAAIMATIFDTDALVEMMSIGTLLAYTLVAVSVLLLRYECSDLPTSPGNKQIATKASLFNWSCLVWPDQPYPTPTSSKAVKYLTAALVLSMVFISIMLTFGDFWISKSKWWAILIVTIMILLSLIFLGLIFRQPQSLTKLHFKTPFVPFLPAISSFINIYLVINLELFTWIRFTVWMGLGFLIYFGYGIWHSSEETPSKQQKHEQKSRDCCHCGKNGDLGNSNKNSINSPENGLSAVFNLRSPAAQTQKEQNENCVTHL